MNLFGNKKLTTRMMKSFEEDATKALLGLTAKSVMSPFKLNTQINLQKRRYVRIKQATRLTSCPRQLAMQYAVSIDQIFTRRSSEPVITYLPE